MADMKLRGPYMTLLAGVALAAVLATLSVTAKASQDAPKAPAGAAQGAMQGAAQGVGEATIAPTSAAPKSVALPPATYAGRVDGGAATLAISVRDGRAIAYLCDGRRTEAWLRGTAADGAVSLSGTKGASLTAAYADGAISGTVSAGGKRWTFKVSVVMPPSGLYRAAADVRTAEIVCGWVRLADGSLVGTCTTAGENPRPAPVPDPASGAATVDGVPLTARPVNGDEK